MSLKVFSENQNMNVYIWHRGIKLAQCNKTFYILNLRLECVSLEARSTLVQCLWVRPGAYPFLNQVGSGLTRKN
jgi:hypothetical protein